MKILQMFLTKCFLFAGIVIRFLGEANTSWSETKKVRDDQGKEHDETEELTGHEEYFENHYYLLGAKSGGEITLPAGEHTYPFTCALPPTLPSSFEGTYLSTFSLLQYSEHKFHFIVPKVNLVTFDTPSK